MRKIVFCIVIFFSTSMWAADKPILNVGSKTFTESYILAEIASQVMEEAGEVTVRRKYGLGTTGIVYQALLNHEIDVYPEYTTTITEAILRKPSVTTIPEIRSELERQNLLISDSLGFDNTYALAVRKDYAQLHGLSRISDLIRMPNIRVGLSYEFMVRFEGYSELVKAYGMQWSHVQTMIQNVAFKALKEDKIDLMDVYSTDASIEKQGLQVLRDDQSFFPKYFSVFMTRKDLASKFPKTWKTLQALAGKMDEQQMRRLNAMADIDKMSYAEVASSFLNKKNKKTESQSNMLLKLTGQHVFLVMFSLLFSIVVGLPLGILSSRYLFLSHIILTVSGLLQTIPSLALLCFLIPFFGIGMVPALVVLFLYGLLPIVTGVHTGLMGLDPKFIESANALGLTPWKRLILVEIPIASRSIIAGIKTSAITGVGTATLAAFIGAGGYGTLIVIGLSMNDVPTILSGAVPSALMALVVHFLFEGMNRVFIPKGLS